MALLFSTRIIAAAGLLAAGLIGITTAAKTGEVSVRTAGIEVKFAHSETDNSPALSINHQQCPPTCPFLDINWKKYQDTATSTALSILS